MRPAAFSLPYSSAYFRFPGTPVPGFSAFVWKAGKCCARTVAFSSLPGGKLQTKRKDTKEKPQCLLAQKERLDRALPCLFAARTIPLYVPFCCAKRWTVEFSSLPGGSCNKKKRYQGKSLIPFGAEGETRTLAPVARPTPLAGAPRHQLEYFCKLTG